MNQHATSSRWIKVLALLAMPAATSPAFGAEQVITRTNWAEHWITNEIEVRMPTNLFVDEFHTNWLRQFHTNVVDVYVTNWVTQTLTNAVPVQATRTVHATEYKTNWDTVTLTNKVAVDAVRTNFVDQWRTNWRTIALTREVAVEVPRTNLVDHWRTNWKTLTLTNWQTVLVMKTNWITQPVTNIVAIDLITNPVAPPQAAASNPPAQSVPVGIETSAPVRAALPTDELSFEAARTERPAANNVAEVQMWVRSTTEAAAPLQIRQWRVESENGAILCSGQDQEFKRELPVGRYRIEVKAQRDANSPLLAARAVLALSAVEAVILPKVSARK